MVTKTTDSGSALKELIKQYLEKRGYKTTEGAKILGKSGAEHTFDLLARRDQLFASHSIGIAIVPEVDEKMRINFLHNCANRAYDVGLAGCVLAVTSPLGQEAQSLANHQHMKIISADDVNKMVTDLPRSPIKFPDTAVFENKAQLIKALENLNYRVERDVNVHGKSGTEYHFDIIAYDDDAVTQHRLVIDFLDGEKELRLEQVSLFEVKSYDVGFSDKAIGVSIPLSREAMLFAQKYAIQVIQIEPKQTISMKRAALELPDTGVKINDKVPVPVKPVKLIPEASALKLVPEVMARRLNLIPISVANNTLTVLMADPTDVFALEAISASTKMRVKPVAGKVDEVRDAIDLNYKGYGEIEKQISNVSVGEEITDERLAMDAAFDAPLAQALSMIVEEAVKTRASDIHLEPEENRMRVRYRIDGILHEMMSLPLNINRALISRIKILSDMNIADHLRPQDGQFSFDAKGRPINVRVATVPCITGEMAVLRLLDKSRASRGLAELGLLPESLKIYESMLSAPYGMILSSGPTGSGKTTTLYACINSLDLVARNVITIEDPAEYHFKSINQIQVNPQAGITFAAGLRSILRLDPNVILVGEIRDSETASIATQAALTGHLLLSSVHANDAATTIARLVDLKVERFLIASSVIGVVAQRMVRLVCPDCGKMMEATLPEQIAYEKAIGEKQTEFKYGIGCESCSYTGYLGRIGIFEILRISDSIRTMIVDGANSGQIRNQAVKEGMVSLLQDGMLKVKSGITTPAEVLRSAYAPE